MSLNTVPPEILRMIDNNLRYEDSINLSQSCSRIRGLLKDKWNNYNQIIISDDRQECRLRDSRQRQSPVPYRTSSAPLMLFRLQNLTEIQIYMKDLDLIRAINGRDGASPYTRFGMLGPLFARSIASLPVLKTLGLNVDLVVDTITNKLVPCPREDLAFALDHLKNMSFETFIQISVCSTEYGDNDWPSLERLIAEIQDTLKNVAEYGAKTDFSFEADEDISGYVDMTVEMGHLEYSFAFFYYNPDICLGVEPSSPQRKMLPPNEGPQVVLEENLEE